MYPLTSLIWISCLMMGLAEPQDDEEEEVVMG